MGQITLPARTLAYLQNGAQKGSRNDELLNAACQLRDAGYSESEAIEKLIGRATADGLPTSEILATIRSAFNRPPRESIQSSSGRNGSTVKTPLYRKIPIEPQRLPSPMDDAAITFLETKFRSGEFVAIGEGYEKRNGQVTMAIVPGVVRSRETWIADIKMRGMDAVFPFVDGLFVRVNPMVNADGRSDKAVAAYRDVLVESDEGQLEEQLGAILNIGLPISDIVHSGDRSVQAHVCIDAPDEATYRERFAFLRQYCVECLGLKMDEKNINPSRYSRLPGAKRTRRDHDTKEKILNGDGQPIIDKQTLLRVNIPGKPWDEWVATLPLDDGLPEIKSLAQIVKEDIPKPPEIIVGLLHQALKLILGGPSKARKTWILMHLALCIATGRKWLGHQCLKGAVLYINFELPEPFFKERALRILNQMGIDEIPATFYELNLRGYAGPAESILPKIMAKIGNQQLVAAVIDPTYKLMGSDRDENAAGDIASLMNEFDRFAVQTKASVISAAHFAKGNAGVKEAIDRIGGSGVFGRDPDSLLIMSPLETDDAFSLDFILRCLPPRGQIAIKWDRCCFEQDEALDPKDLKKSGRTNKYSTEDLLEVLGGESLADKEWAKKCTVRCGMSERTFHRLKSDLSKAKRIYCSKIDDTWSKTSREACKT